MNCPECDAEFEIPFKLAQHIAQEHPEVEEMRFTMGADDE
jgi:hypothetical protein